MRLIFQSVLLIAGVFGICAIGQVPPAPTSPAPVVNQFAPPPTAFQLPPNIHVGPGFPAASDWHWHATHNCWLTHHYPGFAVYYTGARFVWYPRLARGWGRPILFPFRRIRRRLPLVPVLPRIYVPAPVSIELPNFYGIPARRGHWHRTCPPNWDYRYRGFVQ